MIHDLLPDLMEGCEKYIDGNVFHEAGYDAYITGLCFASLTNFLGKCTRILTYSQNSN